MISLRSLFTLSAVAALSASISGCGDLSSNPLTRALQPGSANLDGSVGCTGNACKNGDIDVRVLADKVGNAVIVVHTGTFDPSTGTAVPNGYFQTLQYKVYNDAGKQVLVRNVNFNKSNTTVYSAPIPLCAGNGSDDDDDNGSSSFASCGTHFGAKWKVSVQANVKGVGGDDKKTAVVREDGVNGYLPDVDLSHQAITVVSANQSNGVPAGSPVQFTVNVPNEAPTTPTGPGVFPVQTACVVTVDGNIQLAVPNVVILGHPTNPFAFSYVTGPLLSIPANGHLPCTFNLTLPAGPHTIVVTAAPVIPGDFDYSNNSTQTFTFTASNQPTDIAVGGVQVDYLDGAGPGNLANKPITAGQTVQLDQLITLVSGAAPGGTISCSATITDPNGVATTLTGSTPGSATACKLTNYRFAIAGDYTYTATISTTPADANAANNTTAAITIHASAPTTAISAVVQNISLVTPTQNIVLPANPDTVVHAGQLVTYSADVSSSLVGLSTSAVTCHAFIDGGDSTAKVQWIAQTITATTGATIQPCSFKAAIAESNTSAAGATHTVGVQVTTATGLLNLSPPAPGQGTPFYTVNVHVATRLDISAGAFTIVGKTRLLTDTTIKQGATATFQTTVTGPANTQVSCGTLVTAPSVNDPTVIGNLTPTTLTTTNVTLTNGSGVCQYSVIAPSNLGLASIPLQASIAAVNTTALDPTPANNIAAGTLTISSNGQFTSLPNPSADAIDIEQSWVNGPTIPDTQIGTLSTQQFSVKHLALIVIPTQNILGTFSLSGTVTSDTASATPVNFGTGTVSGTLQAAVSRGENCQSVNIVNGPLNPPNEPLNTSGTNALGFSASVCAVDNGNGFQTITVDYAQALTGPIAGSANPLLFKNNVRMRIVLGFTLTGSTHADQVSATVPVTVTSFLGGPCTSATGDESDPRTCGTAFTLGNVTTP